MNIDERLEALTHNLELLAGMHGESEKRIEFLAGMQSESERRAAETADRMARLEESKILFDRGMLQIATILAKDEQRLDNLEGRNQ